MTSQPSLPPPAEIVLTFLESVGLRSEGEFYVRLFRELPKESFALVLLSASVAEHGLGAVVEQLRFLAHLGLYAPIVLGGVDASDNAAPASELAERLSSAGLGGTTFAVPREPKTERPMELAAQLSSELRSDRVPVLVFPSDTPAADRVLALAALTNALRTQKLVLLRQRGGLGPHTDRTLRLGPGHVVRARSGGISVINLTTDKGPLESSGLLGTDDLQTLGFIAAFSAATSGRVPVNVASPLNLLRELFSVKGAGTLVRAGSDVQGYSTYAELDVERLRRLIESSFGRPLRASFFDESPLAVYLEAGYRAAAIVLPGGPAPVLSKFAVERVAQGEGLGQDLWQRLLRDHPGLIWRARSENPITAWYLTVCDGMQRTPAWHVYWRGIPSAAIPAAVAWLESQPRDFESSGGLAHGQDRE